MHRTTIALSSSVRDRLATYGDKTSSYEQILNRIMDAITPEEVAAKTIEVPHVPHMSRARLEALRRMSPSERLQQAYDLWSMAKQANPQGLRSLIQSRRNRKRSR